MYDSRDSTSESGLEVGWEEETRCGNVVTLGDIGADMVVTLLCDNLSVCDRHSDLSRC